MDAGEPETSETHLQNAERALAGALDQPDSRTLLGNIALIRASNAQNQGNLAETAKYAELSLQLIPEDDLYLRAQAAINFCVFAVMALTSFASGALVTTQGWAWLNVGSLVPVALTGVALAWLAWLRRQAHNPA